MGDIAQPSGTVTLVFTDIEGSTRLLSELGEERYAEALRHHRRVVREVFARFDGYEVDSEGDAFFYAFASAPAAVEAVDEAMRKLVDGPIRVRVGIHTGTPSLDPPKYVGLDVHRAARVMAAGHGGQVLVSHSTCALLNGRFDLRDLGDHRLKDFDAPERLYQLDVEGLRVQFPPLKTISNTNLPRPVSAFVGRSREQAEIAALIRSGERLVTLTGPGGSGKTRLAVEAAAELTPDFRAGVFWVPLATLQDPAFLLETIAQPLGASHGLATHIADRDILLLLDNFEQLVDAATQLGDLLRRCPHLRLIVTSRERLRIDGEREYPLLPLRDADAAELFSARASMPETNAVRELCRRLDNMPLAIELAAARARALTPEQLLERLSRRLDLLKGGRDVDPRQQTLRAAVAWSHDLLSAGEQDLFARLGMFAGGCTLEAAEDIVDADSTTFTSLVDKSLVNASGGRYWMYETIREFAIERFLEVPDADDLHDRHARWYSRLAREGKEGIRRDEPGWLERLAQEQPNLRAALEWSSDHDRVTFLTLASSLGEFWFLRAELEEAERWVTAALELSDLAAPMVGALAPTLVMAHITRGRDGHAQRLLERLLALGKELPVRAQADALHISGVRAAVEGRPREALAFYERSLEVSRRLEEPWLLMQTLASLADVSLVLGQPDAAEKWLQEALELLGKEAPGGVAVLSMLGHAALAQGRVDPAGECFRDALRLMSASAFRDGYVVASIVVGAAAVLATAADVEAACVLVSASRELVSDAETQAGWTEVESAAYDATVAQLEGALEPPKRDALAARGRTLALDEAVSFALEHLDAVVTRCSVDR